MKKHWLNFILHLSSLIYRQKDKMALAGTGKTLFLSFTVLILELLLMVVSFPFYLFIAPEALAVEFGLGESEVGAYRLRRKITFSSIVGILALWGIKLLLGTVFGFYVFGSGQADASALGWNFNSPSEYSYDSSKIQILDGVAVFKPFVVQTVEQVVEPVIEPVVEPEVTPVVTPSAEVTVSPDAAPIVETTPVVEPEPVVEPTPVVEPVPVLEPTPVVEPAPPSAGTGLLKWVPKVSAAELNSCEATLQPLNSLVVYNLRKWTGFEEVATKISGGLHYQLSPDGGATWYSWEGGAWVTGGAKFNSAWEIDQHISKFTTESGQILFKAKFSTDCIGSIQLLNITVTYDENPTTSSPPEPSDDSIGLTVLDTPIVDDTLVLPPVELLPVYQEIHLNDGDTEVAYLETTVAQDSLVYNLGSSSGKSWFSLNNAGLLDIRTFQLAIPKLPGQTFVRLCPGAQSASDVHEGCTGEIKLSSTLASVGSTVLVNQEDPNYWHVQLAVLANIGIGGMGGSEAAILPSCGLLALNQSDTSDYLLTKVLSHLDGVKIVFRYTDENNYWALQFVDGKAVIQGKVDGISALPYGLVPLNFVPETGVNTHVKIQANGSKLRAKFWVDGATEPGWMLHATDNRLLTGDLNVDTNLPSLGSLSTCLEDQNVLEPAPVVTVLTPVVEASAPIDLVPNEVPVGVLQLTSHNVPEVLTVGSSSKITWESAAVSGNVELTYSTDDFATAGQVIAQSTPNDGEFNWVVPNDPSVHVNIKVASVEDAAVSDVNDADFEILAASVAPIVQVDSSIPNTLSIAGALRVGQEYKGASAQLTQTPEGEVRFSVYDSTYGWISVTSNTQPFATGTHFVAGTYDGALLRLYVDSALLVSESADLILADSGERVSTGGVQLTLWDSVLNLEAINTLYLSLQNTPPVLVLRSVTPQDDDGFIDISYKILDAQSQYVSLSQAVYSLTGAFDGEERPITNAPSDVDDDGLNGLSSSPTGIEHLLVWNAPADLGDFKGRVYVRLVGSDGLEEGPSVTSTWVYVELQNSAVEVSVDDQDSGISAAVASDGSFSVVVPVNPGSSGNSGGSGQGIQSSSDSPAISAVSTDSAGNKSPVSQVVTVPATPSVEAKPSDESLSVPAPALTVLETQALPEVSSSGGVKAVPLVSPQLLGNVQEAKTSALIPKPEVASAQQSVLGAAISFRGKSTPNSQVLLFLHSEQALVYSTKTDANGDWTFEHSQLDTELAPGVHTVYAVTYDAGSKVKSSSSEVKSFEIKESRFGFLSKYFDLTTTLLTLILLFLALITYKMKYDRDQAQA